MITFEELSVFLMWYWRPDAVDAAGRLIVIALDVQSHKQTLFWSPRVSDAAVNVST